MEENIIIKKEQNKNFECIFCIVNQGFTDLVMTAAKSAGAKGGTVLKGWGTGNKEMQDFFGLIITPEKELCLILVPKTIRDDVLNAINKGAGIGTKGQGIAFSIPCSDVVGIKEVREQVEENK